MHTLPFAAALGSIFFPAPQVSIYITSDYPHSSTKANDSTWLAPSSPNFFCRYAYWMNVVVTTSSCLSQILVEQEQSQFLAAWRLLEAGKLLKVLKVRLNACKRKNLLEHFFSFLPAPRPTRTPSMWKAFAPTSLAPTDLPSIAALMLQHSVSNVPHATIPKSLGKWDSEFSHPCTTMIKNPETTWLRFPLAVVDLLDFTTKGCLRILRETTSAVRVRQSPSPSLFARTV